MNEFLALIKERRSCRKYRAEQISPQARDAVIEAGRYAPSGGNSQSCHFIAIQKPEVLAELTALVEKAFSGWEIDENTYKSIRNSVARAKQGGYDFSYSAPTLIIVANRKEYSNAMADSACALQNMMLAAEALELGSCWLNQLHWLDENPEIRAYLYTLGLHKEETVCGALGLGYSAEETRSPLARTGNPVTYVE